MSVNFPVGPGISYAVSGAFAVVGEKSYPIAFNNNIHYMPPQSYGAMRGWLRLACAEPQSPVNKDPLDQYLFELCGKVFERLDYIIINICEIRTGVAVEEVRQRINNNPLMYVRVNEPDNVCNYLTESVLAGTLQSVALLHEMTFDIRLKTMSVRPGCAEVETIGGYRYIKNPNPSGISALLRLCRQKSSENDCFNRIKTEPYDLLVNIRDYRETCQIKVPRIVKSVFEVEIDSSCDETAVTELVDDQKLIIRRIYTGGAPLQIFDYKGRCVGSVPPEVCEWLTPVLEYALGALSNAKTEKVILGENRATIGFRVNAHIVVTEKEAFFGTVTYHLVKNFDYPDLKPVIVTARQGLPLLPWLEPIHKLYEQYQQEPQKLALPKEIQQSWKAALQTGAINETPEDTVPPDNDKALPPDVFSADVSSENAIAHYNDMLGDGSIIKSNIDRARVLILKGKACSDNGLFEEAAESFVNAEAVFRKGVHLDMAYLAYIYISLAKIDMATGEHKSAVKQFGRAAAVLERERRHGRRSVLGVLISCYVLGGDECVKAGNSELAVDAYSGAAEILERYKGEFIGDDEQTAELYEKRAELCAAQGYSVQALRDFFKSIEIFESRLIYKKPVNRSIAVNAYRLRGELFEQNGFPELAINDKKRAAQLVKRIKRDSLAEALEQTKLAAQEKQSVIDTVLRRLSGEDAPVVVLPAREKKENDGIKNSPSVSAPLPARFTSGEDLLMEEEEKFRFEKFKR